MNWDVFNGVMGAIILGWSLGGIGNALELSAWARGKRTSSFAGKVAPPGVSGA